MKKAVIVGAGPAGLTAAYELLDRTGIQPVVFEEDAICGGLSRTVPCRGNRIDIGGHRFFSKSDRIMDWWENILPRQGAPARDDRLLSRSVPLSFEARTRPLRGKEWVVGPAPDPETEDRVFLYRDRVSRIRFRGHLLDYPISMGPGLLKALGPWPSVRILFSYLASRARPIRPEKSLEDFFVNRFGRVLYGMFFRDYTEKLWGVPCSQISAAWGAQRVKGVSVAKALGEALRSLAGKRRTLDDKSGETSLIECFLYPKHGPGQLWEEVAARITGQGAPIHLEHAVTGIECREGRIEAVKVLDRRTGQTRRETGDVFFSSMPVQDLIRAFGDAAPPHVREVAGGLAYRDFITVGLLLRKMAIRNETSIPTLGGLIPDTWIYIQEPHVQVGRVQIFNNWSPYLVKDPDTVWIGLEYFCREGDALWGMEDAALQKLGVEEMERIGMIRGEDVLDRTVIRMRKAYPAYFGSYERFDEIRAFLDSFPNLFCIGRNGMHRYNNMDHSMLTAMTAVENLLDGTLSKDNIWNVNVEQAYHEEKG